MQLEAPDAGLPTGRSRGTFGPVRVGYLTDVAGFPKFNVNDSNGNPIAGNSNTGHEGDQYGTNLSPDERGQLIEYLKSL